MSDFISAYGLEDEIRNILVKKKKLPFLNQLYTIVNSNYRRELSKPPRIAIIGRAGVGKSSTINALFGTRLRIGHTNKGTYAPKKVRVNAQSVKGMNGEIVIYDMPGLGDSSTDTEQYIDTYLEILSRCDVAVWVVSAIDRSLAYDQDLIFEVVNNARPNLLQRLIIGVNKVDLVHPGNWNKKINLPSRTQERNFIRVQNRIIRQLSDACPGLNDEGRIFLYSAHYRYNLTHLFNGMLDACPIDRAWLLGEREHIANYLDLVSPEYLYWLNAEQEVAE